ncbi:MAG: hypothetical protein QOD77_1620 [Thermoplasmata archaeon]|jgi:hypothetical protein|nr:hypothetical protein [Thermoplasmata archaeon]
MAADQEFAPWKRRMTCFDPYFVKLGRQPPVRSVFCFPPRQPKPEGCAVGAYCKGAERSCGVCGFAYCEDHARSHRKRLTAPVDAWRSVRRQLLDQLRFVEPEAKLHTSRRATGPLFAYVLAGRVRQAEPPAVVAYCSPPTTRNADLACCYPAKTCTPGSTECQRCFFTFCDGHLLVHAYRFAVPRQVARDLFDSFHWHIDRAAENPREHRRRRGIRIQVPPIRGLLP